MLERLAGVSPQPPSAFACAASHAAPRSTSRRPASLPAAHVAASRRRGRAVARAMTAVAVESALRRQPAFPVAVGASGPAAARRARRRASRLELAGAGTAAATIEMATTWSQAQVAEREQAIVRVLAVEDVVFPVAVEAAPVGPQGIDEVEARLLDAPRCRRAGRPARGSPWRSTADRGSASPAARGSRPADAPATAATAPNVSRHRPCRTGAARAAPAAVAVRQPDRRAGEVVEAAVGGDAASGAAPSGASLSGTGSRRSW